MATEEVRYATGDMMADEVQNKDVGMRSEDVKYAIEDMLSGEVQNKDEAWSQRR